LSSLINEEEEIRVAISQLTGAKFETREIKTLPGRFANAMWFMRCREITQANKIPYVNSIWREVAEIRVESLTIGNASQWIEQAYGEEAVYPVVGADLTEFASDNFRNEFLKPFPKIKRKLALHEQILRRVSKKRGVQLELRYEGRKGLASFYLDAIVDVDSKSVTIILEDIAISIDALKEAYEQIGELPSGGSKT
jgi:hypothetical protein